MTERVNKAFLIMLALQNIVQPTQSNRAVYLMQSFIDILQKPTVFANRNVLSPHFVPIQLPFRERELEKIMVCVSPALQGSRPRNIFLYGKTGTGKTACVRRVMSKFEALGSKAKVAYVNCRIYNSRYKVLQKALKGFLPEIEKSGFGITFMYEKMLDWIATDGKFLILALDEVDMVKDLDELVYSLTRSNDEIPKGGISIIGISNNLSFKDRLDSRSKSALFETELVFAPYNTQQLAEILLQRSVEGFKQGVVSESAVSLAAAAAANETGDARYALRLLLRAGEIADERLAPDATSTALKVTDKEVDAARRAVDEDVAKEAICTLPEHQQLVLLSVANLTLAGGSRYAKLSEENNDGFLFSGEVYEEYLHLCKVHAGEPRSARWYREYLHDLEMLGLITMIDSGKGVRGHTRFIKIGFSAPEIKSIIERNIQEKNFAREIADVEGASG